MKFTYDQLLEGSKLLILPSRPMFPFSETLNLNKAFLAWQTNWQEVESSTGFSFNADEFYRQNAILVLLDPNGDVMGCHLYSFFNLKTLAANNTSFFAKFDESYKRHLIEREIVNSFSVEYLTVCKKYRRNGELSLARAIISLSCKVLENSMFDGILAQTRDDVKVNKMAEEFGGEVVSQGFKMNGIASSFVIFQKGSTVSGDSVAVDRFVQALWSRRVDLSRLTHQEEKVRVAA